MRSQKPAPLPQNRPRRTAISGETAERSARIECSICRETPSCRAVSATVRLSGLLDDVGPPAHQENGLRPVLQVRPAVPKKKGRQPGLGPLSLELGVLEAPRV